MLITAAVFLLAAGPAYACQESCRVIEGNPLLGQLLDPQAKELSYAKIVIRQADPSEQGPKTFCGGRKGRVVKRLTANGRGKFELRGLPVGTYWITYLDKENGESFFVSRVDNLPAKDLPLTIRSFANLCYLVDIEQNVTIPPGWNKPVLEPTP